MIKLALLGAWHVHTEGFVREALKTGLAELKVVWDTDSTRGLNFAEKFSVPFQRDLDKVLLNPEIDAVIVECPTTKHKEVILKAAYAKKHIFTDKTLALSVNDALEIKKAIEENNVKFAISLESKELGAYAYAKQIVDEGKLGRITAMYFRRAHQAALDPNMLPSYWFDTTQTGGGATLDLGCHGLYLLPHFCGTPKKVTSVMNELYGTGSDEISTTVIEFENGTIGTAHTSFVSYRLDNMLEIIGTEGILVISGTNDHNFQMLLQSKNIPGYKDMKPVFSYRFPENKVPSAEFVKLLASEKPSLPIYDIDKAVDLTRLIECAYRSAKEERTVEY